jgi:hypothetical protein
MNIQIQPGVTITLKGLYYQVAGIDTYTLHNQIEPSKQWKSYTLVGNNQRIGLTQIDNEFELWDSVPDNKIPTSQLTFNLEMSGIASISFEGDRGPSTSISEIVWFDINNDPDRDLVTERFLYIKANQLKKVETFFYLGEKINRSQIKW